MKERQILRGALLEAWNRKLYLWWRIYNREYLSGALKEPLIQVGRAQQVLGCWEGERRVLTISESHILNDPWLRVTDTLRHEMAHQYVEEVLEAGHEPPHGPAFREACLKLRCRPRARASRTRPGESMSDTTEDRVLRRLKKVLSLADSPNQHEAHAAVQKARYLLSRYSIDLVELDQERQFDSRPLGEVKGRHMAYELWLATILNEFFFVEVIWAQSYDACLDRSGTVLQVFGTSTHLEMAEYVYGYLTQLMGRLWAGYKQTNSLTSNRQRQRFLAGLMEGFYHKLQLQEQRLQENRALVWKGDPRLESYFRFLNPRIQTRYWGATRRTEVYRDGVRAGGRVRISRPIPEPAQGVTGQLASGRG